MSPHTVGVLFDLVLGTLVLVLALVVAFGWGNGGSDDRDF